MYAAVPEFKWGDKPYKVKVCRVKYPDRCVVVVVRDCLCSKKTRNMIDLSPAAFMRLSTLATGRVLVTMEAYYVRYRGR
jgi:expansin (peptidoglycan-binding protein)